MRWRATAHLTAGAAITATGIACLARTRRARYLPLAALPALPGGHQLVEAAVRHSGGGCVLAGYLFATLGALLISGDRLLRLSGLLRPREPSSARRCGGSNSPPWCAFAAAASTPILVWTGRRVDSPCVREAAAGRAPGL